MDYLEKAKDEIRKQWFGKHEIKSIKGEDGFQEIIFGKLDSSMYQVKYVLAGNMVYISGDLGVAAFELTGPATIDELKHYDLSYFTRKLVASQRSKYEFDDKKARKEIEEYFIDWCDVENVNELTEEDRELYDELITEAGNWSTPEQFSTGVYVVYQNTSVDWFDGEMASCIADCGQNLSYSIISYWVGLQMVAELYEKESVVAD